MGISLHSIVTSAFVVRTAAPLAWVLALLLSLSPTAQAATPNEVGQQALQIPAGKYQLTKGDDLCDGPISELEYFVDGEDITVALGEGARFANFNKPSYSEEVNNGPKTVCTVTTTAKLKAKSLESKVVQSCKDKSQDIEQSQSLVFDGIKLVYSMTRVMPSEKKPFKINCEYLVDGTASRGTASEKKP